MADLPHVSVVIPAYNAAERLPTALDSVRAQTYPSEKLEVIVVDDGSTDDTAAVAREHLRGASPMETQVMSVENGGPSWARNVGWRRSSGEWIQFLDDDDLLTPGKIETQAAYAKTVGSEAAVLHSDWERMSQNEDGEWVVTGAAQPRIDPEDPLVDLLSAEGFIHLGSALFKKGWLDTVSGFDERYSLIEDVHLLLRVAIAGGQFVRVPSEQSLFLYRDRGGDSLSGQSRVAFAEGCARNARLVEEHWRKNKAFTDARKRALCDAYFYAARQLAAAGSSEFKRVWSRIKKMDSSALPPHPPHFRFVSRVLGYPCAEQLSIAFRRLKAWLGLSVPGFSE